LFYSPNPAMSNPQPACGPVEVFCGRGKSI